MSLGAIGLFISSTNIKLITEENHDLALVCALHQGNPYDVPDCAKLLNEITEKNIPKKGFIFGGIVLMVLTISLVIIGLIKNKS